MKVRMKLTLCEVLDIDTSTARLRIRNPARETCQFLRVVIDMRHTICWNRCKRRNMTGTRLDIGIGVRGEPSSNVFVGRTMGSWVLRRWKRLLD
jgi:hypothetical protein